MFALALDEQLYDFTDDSYKAPALNTFSRTLELQSVAQANHLAGISKEALRPFIEELEWSIAKDPALSKQQRALCKVHLASINENLGEPDRIARGVSGLRIVLGKYLDAIISEIRLIIENSPNRKLDLVALASSFIVQAETTGFPRRHTYHTVQNSFIRHLKYKDAFDPKLLLDDFFTGFPVKPTQFDCVFLAEGEFRKFPKVLAAFSLKALETPPDWENVSKDQRLFLESRQPSQLYLTVEGLQARSPVKAHEVATAILDEFAALVGFHEHKLVFKPTSLSLVREVSSKRIYRIRDAPDAMHCWVTHAKSAEQDVLALAAATHGKELTEASSNRLRRAVRLHRSALQSNSAENQLIDLWAGLEGLVTRPGKESQRLEYFAECLLPSLILSYPEKLFVSAYRDLTKVEPAATATIAKLSGDDSSFSKFVRIVLCTEHGLLRTEIIENLKNSPLLLNKIWRLSQNFKNRATVKHTLRHHRQKVRWHLARIYHTRNSIMHSAQALPYLSAIVENLHFYVDTLIKSIQKTAAISPERLTIEGALQYLASWEKYQLDSITRDGEDSEALLKDSDVWGVLFGINMALAPNQDRDLVTP